MSHKPTLDPSVIIRRPLLQQASVYHATLNQQSNTSTCAAIQSRSSTYKLPRVVAKSVRSSPECSIKVVQPPSPKAAHSLRSAKAASFRHPFQPSAVVAAVETKLQHNTAAVQPKQAQPSVLWQRGSSAGHKLNPPCRSLPRKKGLSCHQQSNQQGCSLAKAFTASPIHITDVAPASCVLPTQVSAQQPQAACGRGRFPSYAAPHAQPLLRCSPSVAFTWRAHARRPPHTARGTTRRPSHGRSTHVWGWGPSRSTKGWRPTHRAPEWRGAAHWTSKWRGAAVATHWPAKGGRAHHACVGNAAQGGEAGRSGGRKVCKSARTTASKHTIRQRAAIRHD